ncbi:MAG: PEP-CTERM sorting domain-containing protein [Candidatus Omnitrophica bacterium]|nr:PEP-CTERM sorting domain-containing protein [Candidatus Omnitrophota bacterium]
MKNILLLTFIIIYSAFLAGCEESGNGPGFSSFSDSSSSSYDYYASAGSSGGSSSWSSTSSSSSSSSDTSAASGAHSPEPASMALLGAGLFGLLGAKLRKRKGR